MIYRVLVIFILETKKIDSFLFLCIIDWEIDFFINKLGILTLKTNKCVYSLKNYISFLFEGSLN